MGTGTLFYVHGSGNRLEKATKHAKQLRAGFGLDEGSETLRASTWGESCGPKHPFALLDSILPAPSPAETDDVVSAAAADALAPLRSTAAAAESTALAGSESSVDVDWPAARLLSVLKVGFDLPAAAVSASSVRRAAAEVEASPEFAVTARLDDVEALDHLLVSTVAVAVDIEARSGFGGDADPRSSIERAAANTALVLLGATPFFGEAVPRIHLPAKLKLALSRRLAPYRGDLTRRALPVPADVISYQRRVRDIRDHVRSELAECERPVVALGHSLGGIILVDALLGRDAPDIGVRLLVTFGSQSSLLQATTAIDDVVERPGLTWLNVWTRYDFVSFLMGRVWPFATDWELVEEVGFPDAHGIYYESSRFFARLRDEPAIADILS